MKKILLFCAVLLIAAVAMAQTPTVSASSVTFKFCQTTYGSSNVYAYTFPIIWNEVEYTQGGVWVRTLTNARGCDSIVTLNVIDTEGEIPFPFTVDGNNNASSRVFFSKGNLQICPMPLSDPKTHTTADGQYTNGIWRFAEHQWDNVESGIVYNEYNQPSSNGNIHGESVCDWIDVFYYGRPSGNVPGTPRYFGHISQTDHDWGWYNAISNGGNVIHRWYTLTTDQWKYLFNTRSHAKELRSYGMVNNIRGLILLPDNWVLPEGLSFTACASNINLNTYNVEEWGRMEQHGAVFLPFGGGYTTGWQNNQTGYYWPSDANTTRTFNKNYGKYYFQYRYFVLSAPNTDNYNADIVTTSASGEGGSDIIRCMFSVRLVRTAH